MDGAVLNAIVQVSLLVFVVSSMLAMGLSLTVGDRIDNLFADRWHLGMIHPLSVAGP